MASCELIITPYTQAGAADSSTVYTVQVRKCDSTGTSGKVYPGGWVAYEVGGATTITLEQGHYYDVRDPHANAMLSHKVCPSTASTTWDVFIA